MYFSLKEHRHRLWLLFFSSCFFYGFFIPAYLLVLFLVIGIDYYAGLQIEAAQTSARKKLFLYLSLGANIAILAFFKYINFMITNWNELATLFRWNYSLDLLQIVLPIGLSFHTFQSMAYVLEVYHGRFKSERDLLTYSVYVLYFPQLVAGPIERPQNILPQLHAPQNFEERRTVTGLYLIAQGLIKKVVVADALAPVANQIFANPDQYGAFATLAGIICFSFQIYCDFSGYSDIACGTSRVFGIELMRNFSKPYFATSIGNFWRRWHISLSTWFRDYVFVPAGGSRGTGIQTAFNLMLIFMLSGLWHGANWTFVVWGTLHGFYLIAENFLLKSLGQKRWPTLVGRIYVFVLVAITWVFFRADSIRDAKTVLAALTHSPLLGWERLETFQLQESLVLIACLLAFEALDEAKPFWDRVAALAAPMRWVLYWGIVWIFLLAGQFSGTQFIYFQF